MMKVMRVASQQAFKKKLSHVKKWAMHKRQTTVLHSPSSFISECPFGYKKRRSAATACLVLR